ncbi:MAG: hypothetical protein KDC87_17320, partial [Planctomycetes bacterium]|nr:hypothetical protein [Planctomycetota bacterium]
LVVALLSLHGLGAQQNVKWYPDNLTTGSANAFPFGSAGIRYQCIVPRANFGTNTVGVLRDILVNAGTYPNTEIVYDDIEIRMGVTSQAIPTTNWSTNNPNPTLVYRGPMRIRFQTGTWTAIGLPKPYLFILANPTDNLCIEVICWAIQGYTAPNNFYFPLASSTANRAFLYNWTNTQTSPPNTGTSGCKMGLVVDSGSVAFAGVGCNSSSNTPLVISTDTYPSAGNPITIKLAGARSTTPALLVVGLSSTKWLGLPLPLDMGIFGAPGCMIWNDPILQVGAVTNTTGAIDFKVTIPSAFGSGTVYAHWWVRDVGANSFGVTTSDYATFILGS